MRVTRLLWAGMLLCLLLPSAAWCRTARMPSFAQTLAAGSGYVIPAAWAGIWTYNDTTYTCAPLTYDSDDSGLDTLCAGASFEPDSTTGFNYNCTGTITDTQLDLTCTGSFDFSGCTVSFTQTSHGTRSGESVFVRSTFVTSYSPPAACFGQLDSCEQTNSHLTRIAPQPASCTTAVRHEPWGALKVRYR